MPRPSTLPTWTDGDAEKQVEPSSGKRALGWTASERIPFEYLNNLFYNLGLWIEWLDEVTEGAVATYPLIYNAIVGSADGCTHETLADALADSAVTAGMRILVLDSVGSLASTVQVTKNNITIEFHPGVTYTNSSAGTAIQVSADGVKIKGGRFSGFTTAILIDAGSDYTSVSECRFASCTNEVTDNNGTGTTFGTISE